MADGRPSTKDRTAPIKFRVPKPLAAYMLLLGNEFGWGLAPSEVARHLVMREVARLQEAEMHNRRPSALPALTDAEDEETEG